MKHTDDMMCEEFSKHLDNYELLTEAEKGRMTVHASKCEKCKSELDFYLSMLSTVRSLPRIEPPADFMDSLNERLDKEDTKAAPRRILYHIRNNGRQYAAAAACLALVTVLTANRGMLIDRFDGTHGEDGVVIDETIADNDYRSDNTAAVTPVPRIGSEEPADAPTDKTDNRESKSDGSDGSGGSDRSPKSEQKDNGWIAALPAASPAAANKKASSSNSIPTKTAAAASSVASTPAAAKTAQTQIIASVSISNADTGAPPEVSPAAKAADTEAIGSAESSAPAIQEGVIAGDNDKKTETGKDIKSDYSIALAGSLQSNETASASSYDMRAEDVSASLSAEDVVSGYSLAGEAEENIAYGRYYRLDKDGNPMEDEDEPAAIGNLKISSSDADKAMDIINNCPHGEDGGLYTTDSGNFALMLSMLSSEGVSYTNYTPGGDGNVQFRIVFN